MHHKKEIRLKPNPDWAKLPLFNRTGWRRMAFGEFAESIGDRAEPKDAQEENYVGLEHLASQCLHIRRWGKGSDVIGGKLRFRKGDIIFGKRRAYQRKLAVAEFDGICSAHALVVRAKPDKVLPEFLPFLMMSDRFMNRAVEISVGSLSPTINWTTLKLEKFDLPPLDQQRRIAEILWAVDEAITRYKELSCGLDSDIVGKRKRFFEIGRRTTRRLGELFEVQLGKMLSQKSRTGEGAFRYLGNKNVQWGRFDFGEMLEMDFSPEERMKFSLRDGDLLVCEGGEVGRSAIWNPVFGECYYQKALHRLRPLSDEIATTYMLEFMYWANERGLFSSLTGHSTIAHLPVVKLKRVEVPVASFEEQMAFVRELDSARDGLRVVCDHIKDIRDLLQSFLTKVFP